MGFGRRLDKQVLGDHGHEFLSHVVLLHGDSWALNFLKQVTNGIVRRAGSSGVSVNSL